MIKKALSVTIWGMMLVGMIQGVTFPESIISLPNNPAQYAEVLQSILWQQVEKENIDSPEWFQEYLIINNEKPHTIAMGVGGGRIVDPDLYEVELNLAVASKLLRYFNLGLSVNWYSHDFKRQTWKAPLYDSGIGLSGVYLRSAYSGPAVSSSSTMIDLEYTA